VRVVRGQTTGDHWHSGAGALGVGCCHGRGTTGFFPCWKKPLNLLSTLALLCPGSRFSLRHRTEPPPAVFALPERPARDTTLDAPRMWHFLPKDQHSLLLARYYPFLPTAPARVCDLLAAPHLHLQILSRCLPCVSLLWVLTIPCSKPSSGLHCPLSAL
jgi:hypothetical protein